MIFREIFITIFLNLLLKYFDINCPKFFFNFGNTSKLCWVTISKLRGTVKIFCRAFFFSHPNSNGMKPAVRDAVGNNELVYKIVGMAIYRCRIDISIFLNFECDTIFYFTYWYTFDISHQLSVITFYLFHLVLSHLISLDQNLKNAYIFVLHNFLDVFR